MPEVDFASEPQIVTGPDGVRYELVVTGTADVIRGPLGRFIDLAEAIRAEGLEVPAEITEALERLQPQGSAAP
jgi:hypothetical protein